MPLVLYNTLTRKKEVLKTVNPGKVGMYVCGVTVYDFCHVGHARSLVVFDTLYRYLLHTGYDVTFVRNFTDIDDKIIEKAKNEGKSFRDISEFYINAFYEDTDPLNLLRPTHEPKATDHIPDMISAIEKLIEKGHAYVSDGDVYFSVDSFPGYGKLSGRRLEDMMAGARVEVSEKKKNPLDFALWKRSKEGEPFWESPWGRGRPGWHIECSVMAMKYIGETLDIHGGGRDLIFPHHENEIAQSEALTGKPFSRFWVHNGFVTLKGDKMSKSTGNILNLRDLYKAFHPETLRLFILSTHYRSPVEFSTELLKKAEVSLERVYITLRSLDELLDAARLEGLNDSLLKDDFIEEVEEAKDGFYASMDDDLNTAKALGFFFEVVRLSNRLIENTSKKSMRKKFPDLVERIVFIKKLFFNFSFVLGVFGRKPSEFLEELYSKRLERKGIKREYVEELVAKRGKLRKDKRFSEADSIRDELKEKGVILEDTPQGTRWRVEP